jgi:outer membrane protein OmpA-like peptidoglycan-associated protein
MEKKARFAGGVLLALGFADLAVLDLVLAPRLEHPKVAASPAPAPLHVAPPAPASCPPPPPPATATAATLPASIVRVTEVEATPDLFFDLGEIRVPAARADDVRRLANELREGPQRRIVVKGHADRLGPSDKNVRISWQRAESVKRLLVAFGAPPERVVVEAAGDAEPLSPDDSPRGWARNRRVQVLWR